MTDSSPWLADCHLHFEGCLPAETVERLAKRSRHSFSDCAQFEQCRRAIRDTQSFLSAYAEVCRLFCSPDDYAEAAREIPRSLAAGGVRYAEIYVSPEIFSRIGLEPAACLAAVDAGLKEGSAKQGISCRILLDAVRHWGVESANRVLDLYEKHPLDSIVGFGIGGDEKAIPAAAFGGVYLRARSLGLKTSVHAGEWGDSESLKQALDSLRPDRVDHGISAVHDPELLARLSQEETTLCVAPSGNARTGAVAALETHPLALLLDAGVRVALSADDPLLFATTTIAEYSLARDRLRIAESQLRRMAENSWRAAFCPDSERQAGIARVRSFDFSH